MRQFSPDEVVTEMFGRQGTPPPASEEDYGVSSIGERSDFPDTMATDIQALPVIDPAEWQDQPVPAREWSLKDWIPLRQATLLTGRGGVGKSLITQQLMTCTALGLPFLGINVRSVPALYLSCEDDAEELHRRQVAICESLGVTLSALSGRLHLAAMSGRQGNHLATFDQSGQIIVSDRFRQIERYVIDREIGAVALDNATHFMLGNHNEISDVGSFLNLLNGLAIRMNGAVLLLHHPNKVGDDWLGSVSYENQVRSRILMKGSEVESDSDARSLQNPKANYSPSGGRIKFRWHRGAFVLDDALSADPQHKIEVNSRAAADNAIFMTCLAERTRQQRAVSEKRSPSFAPAVFVKMPEAKGVTKSRLEAAMDRLFRTGKIERAELWKGPDRKPVFGLRATRATAGNGQGSDSTENEETVENSHLERAGNGAYNTMRETRGTVGKPAENHAEDAGNTYTIPKGIKGAPLGAAAPTPESEPSLSSRRTYDDDYGLPANKQAVAAPPDVETGE